MAYVILWEFRVRKGSEKIFESAYGTKGAWAHLFGKSKAYKGTELFRDPEVPRRYLTVDRWTSSDAFDKFRRSHAKEYQQLDKQCEGLTESDAAAGTWATEWELPAAKR